MTKAAQCNIILCMKGEGASNQKAAALILNGNFIPDKIEGEYVLCADGGYNLIRRAGIRCDAVIGDMDSVSGAVTGVEAIPYNMNKDQTDGHLGIMRLCGTGFTRINIYGALGGRADQVAGNINLLPIAYYLGADAVIYDEDTEIYFTDAYLEIPCEKGDLISVLPYSERVLFKESGGLIYPLAGLSISRLTSQGISNVAVSETVSVSVKKGAAFVYRIKS